MVSSPRTAQAPRQRTVIAAHLVLTLYGHWAVNDPRGSGSTAFIDPKFAPLGPIHHGRKPQDQQPSTGQLRAFHAQHRDLLNFPTFWIDDAMRSQIAHAIAQVLRTHSYTCYACAICANHLHLVLRTHRHRAPTMWNHLADAIRTCLRRDFPDTLAPNHPVISARPHNVLLFTPTHVRSRIAYIQNNPVKEGLPPQHWPFVTPYNNWPLHAR